MRILFLSDNFPPEGNAPATRLYEHAIRWVRSGNEVTVVTCAPNFPEGKLFPGYRNAWRQVETVDGIRVVRVKTYITANEGFLRRTLDYLSFMLMGFAMALFERRPDVVVATSPQFFCAIAGWAVSVARRRPFVLFLYRRATAIVAVTESFRRELIGRGVDGQKIHVVVNGVDATQYQPRPRSPALEADLGLQSKFVAGYLGTHGLAHALDKVVEAAALLSQRADIIFLGLRRGRGPGSRRSHGGGAQARECSNACASAQGENGGDLEPVRRGTDSAARRPALQDRHPSCAPWSAGFACRRRIRRPWRLRLRDWREVPLTANGWRQRLAPRRPFIRGMRWRHRCCAYSSHDAEALAESRCASPAKSPRSADHWRDRARRHGTCEIEGVSRCLTTALC